jgi:2'-5' RNA ligase/GNAT superfamily N-acetyltransferase
MARRRLGVALLVPGPAATEIDGLRRALGDGAFERIPAHLTLVPPVNVPEAGMPDALAVLRAAAAATPGPLHLRLGPAATFHPVTPVVYLAVEGDLDGLATLRTGLFRPPLARRLTHPFVPHVTLADDMDPERIPAAVAALTGARLHVTVDRVHLLGEESGRLWHPIADAPLAPPAVVGRGGLPLELTVSSQPDPEAVRLLVSGGGGGGAGDGSGDGGEGGGEGDRAGGEDDAGGEGDAGGQGPLAVAARRDGQLVGAAHGWTVGPLTRLAALVVAEGVRRQGVGAHLLAAVEREARVRGSGALDTVAPDHPAATALLAGAGWRTAGVAYPGWRWWHRPLG